MSLSGRRVVVTGIGAITPLGGSFRDTWKGLLDKACGVTSLQNALHQQEAIALDELDLSKELPCQVAAPVLREFYNGQSFRNTARFVEFALLAGSEALRQANLLQSQGEQEQITSDLDRERVGVSIGSGMSSVREVVLAAHTIEKSGLRRVSPHFVPTVLSNSAAGRLSIQYSLQGPNTSVSTACAAGTHAIGDAMRYIQYGAADVMLAGGAEAAIDVYSLNGFCRLRALSTSFNDIPEESSRPFDSRRNGFVMGEGAAVLVLEEKEHAIRRQAPILAELVGYGLTGDAYHVTAPEPEGKGAKRAMEMALGSIDGSRVGYVNAHATSTPMGDAIEALAIDTVLRRSKTESQLHVSSTKGATGHLLGAAGALEAAFTVQGLKEGVIPPTINLQDAEESKFRHVRDTLHVPDLTIAMSNSFGFGGTNATLLFEKST